LNYRELIKLLEQDGWYLHQTTGSHQQYKHPTKPGRVTVAGKRGKDVPAGTLKSVLRQAGLN
jgi:predicted RNA binding protein YcfA (HicA-like mRNA interferase family)